MLWPGSHGERPGPRSLRSSCSSLGGPAREPVESPHPGTDTPTADGHTYRGSPATLTPSCSAPQAPPRSPRLLPPPNPAPASPRLLPNARFQTPVSKRHLDPSPELTGQPGRRKGTGLGIGALALAWLPACWVTFAQGSASSEPLQKQV